MSVDFLEDGGAKPNQKNRRGTSTTPILDNFSRDLIKLAEEGKIDPVVGRDNEVKRISQILSRKKKNNVVIVGDAGVGKSALVEKLAIQIHKGMCPSNLTGVITSVGPATSIASQTGTGTKFVVDTSPTLVTPVLGVATATSINGTTIPSTATLVTTGDTTLLVPSQTGQSGKYLTTNGTASSWDTVSSGSATYYQTSAPTATAVGELWVDSDATASIL